MWRWWRGISVQKDVDRLTDHLKSFMFSMSENQGSRQKQESYVVLQLCLPIYSAS